MAKKFSSVRVIRWRELVGLNDIKRVGPCSYRINILYRKRHHRSISLHCEDEVRRLLSTSQEESLHQKLIQGTCRPQNYEEEISVVQAPLPCPPPPTPDLQLLLASEGSNWELHLPHLCQEPSLINHSACLSALPCSEMLGD